MLSYPPSELDKRVKNMAIEYFAGFYIDLINEINADGISPIYMINIESETQIKVIKVVDDTIEVQEELEKE
jgi:hypothetical protein